jgi:type I restriction enzyme M protein
VLKASKKDNKTLFIDASAEFVRGGNKNKLTDENRARILKAFTARKDDDHFAQQNEMRTAIDVIVAEIDAIR